MSDRNSINMYSNNSLLNPILIHIILFTIKFNCRLISPDFTQINLICNSYL